jgi:YVTN family beta-propeller protein
MTLLNSFWQSFGHRVFGRFMMVFRRVSTVLLVCLVAVLQSLATGFPTLALQGPARFAGPISSGPLALSADSSLLAVVNPDNNSVSLFDVANDKNQLLGEIPVGKEPWGVGITPDGGTVYVANHGESSVSVLKVNKGANPPAVVTATIAVGVEPYGIAVTPNGTAVYVANTRSNSVSVIDTSSNVVNKTIVNIGPATGGQPTGLAITNNGNELDTDETVYVTNFYSFANNKLDGEDDSKTGLVTKIATQTNAVTGQIVLKNLADTGFKATGDAIAKQESKQKDNKGNLVPTFVTGAYPNQMQAIAVKNNFAYLPNVGASPNGPVRFNVATQALVSVINTSTNQDAGQTVNLNKIVAAQPDGTRKLFPAIPWAIAFKTKENVGYVVSAASNIVLKVTTDPATGAVTVAQGQDKRVADFPVGRNPRGILINGTDTRAYVMNYISRDVTVLDLTRFPEQVIATMRSAPLPVAGSPEELVQTGKELYNTSVGEFENSAGNMSADGWQACASCHPFGLSDNVVWIFGAGPRRTISQHQDFAGDKQRALNWSGIFDEEQDFELNIRGASGGKGLLLAADGSNLEVTAKIGGLVVGTPPALAVPNASRGQVKARTSSGELVDSWSAIVTYVKTIRAPVSPLANSTDPEIAEGRSIFISNNCQSCHGGPKWSKSAITPPVTQAQLKGAQIGDQLTSVGTFNPADKNEVNAAGKPPLGADGFVPPSLLSVFAFPPYFHNGSAPSLDAVLSDKFSAHRAAGTGGVDGLTNPEDRRKLVKFLLSIDGSTEPIAP